MVGSKFHLNDSPDPLKESNEISDNTAIDDNISKQSPSAYILNISFANKSRSKQKPSMGRYPSAGDLFNISAKKYNTQQYK